MSKSRILAVFLFGGLLVLGLTLYAKSSHPSSLFMEYCARCHGKDGRANTPKGKKLGARDFTDAEWQAEESDADLIEIVTKGGEDMPAFGKKLTREQIEGLVKQDVRGFARKEAQKSKVEGRKGSAQGSGF